MGNNDMRLRKRLREDREGALEGLPLYMVILVVIAAVSIVILLGWTSSLQGRDLGDITITPQSVTDGERSTVVVKAFDTSGKPLSDVTITMDGAGVSEMKLTNSRGEASFTFTPELLGQNYGEIQIIAKYTGTILVQIPKTVIVQL